MAAEYPYLKPNSLKFPNSTYSELDNFSADCSWNSSQIRWYGYSKCIYETCISIGYIIELLHAKNIHLELARETSIEQSHQLDLKPVK